ncbi:MAG: NERD domain-containing protein, partial [Eubacterium sp.]|nr:NERD domain-containing protein [Eubacterium sp.]
INNISLNIDGKKTEIDNLIVNQNGIFVVENKNYNGKLYGNIDDYEWIKEKVSPGGNTFTKYVRNPIKQTKRQIYILSKYLKNNNIRIWIKGYTYFINQNSPVEDEYVINNIYELDQIIHNQQDRIYDKKLIDRTIDLLYTYKSV